MYCNVTIPVVIHGEEDVAVITEIEYFPAGLAQNEGVKILSGYLINNDSDKFWNAVDGKKAMITSEVLNWYKQGEN